MLDDLLVRQVYQMVYTTMWPHTPPIQGITPIPLKRMTKRVGRVQAVSGGFVVEIVGHEIPIAPSASVVEGNRYYAVLADHDYLTGFGIDIPTDRATPGALVSELANGFIFSQNGTAIPLAQCLTLLSGVFDDDMPDDILILVPVDLMDSVLGLHDRLTLQLWNPEVELGTYFSTTQQLIDAHPEDQGTFLYRGKWHQDTAEITDLTQPAWKLDSTLSNASVDINTLPMFLDTYRQLHYIFTIDETLVVDKTVIINPTLCIWLLKDNLGNGILLNEHLRSGQRSSITHRHVAWSKAYLQHMAELLPGDNAYLTVYIPEHAKRGHLMDENNLLSILFEESYATILSYLIKPIANNPTGYWSAEHLFESEYSRIIEACHPKILNRYHTLGDYAQWIGDEYLQKLLTPQMVTLVTPDTKVSVPMTWEGQYTINLYAEDGVLVDPSEYSHTESYHQITLDYSGLNLVDGTSLFVELLPNHQPVRVFIPTGSNRSIPRVEKDYILMKWNTVLECWEDVTADIVREQYLEHVMYNNQLCIQFKVAHDASCFMVLFGSDRYDHTLTFQGSTSYALTCEPTHYWSNDVDILKITRSNILAVYQGSYDKLHKVMAGDDIVGYTDLGDASLISSGDPHPNCMDNCGITFESLECLKYSPSSDMVSGGYELLGFELSYAFFQPFPYGSNSSFCTEADITNYSIRSWSRLEATRDHCVPPDPYYNQHRLMSIRIKDRTVTIDWDKVSGHNYFLKVTEDDFENDGSIILDFGLIGDDTIRIAKCHAIFKHTGSSIETMVANFTYPLRDVTSCIHVDGERLMEGIDFVLSVQEAAPYKSTIRFLTNKVDTSSGTLPITLYRKVGLEKVITLDPGFDPPDTVGSPMELTGAQVSSSYTDPNYPPESVLVDSINASYRNLPNAPECWINFRYDYPVKLGALYIESSANASNPLQAPLRDVYVEAYDAQSNLIAVAHIDELVPQGILIERFFAPDAEGNPTTRVFETLTIQWFRIIKRTIDSENRGLALNRVIAYDVHTDPHLNATALRKLGLRIVNNRVIPPEIDYEAYMAGSGTPTTIEYGDEVLIYGHDVRTRQALDASQIKGGLNYLRLLS